MTRRPAALMTLTVLLCYLAPIVGAADATTSGGEVTALHRGMHEISLRASEPMTNPYFGAPIQVTFRRPDGSEVIVDGSHVGDATVGGDQSFLAPGSGDWILLLRSK